MNLKYIRATRKVKSSVQRVIGRTFAFDKSGNEQRIVAE